MAPNINFSLPEFFETVYMMFEKITPETYEKMNEEFEEEGLAFRIIVPTQEQIDEWRGRD